MVRPLFILKNLRHILTKKKYHISSEVDFNILYISNITKHNFCEMHPYNLDRFKYFSHN